MGDLARVAMVGVISAVVGAGAGVVWSTVRGGSPSEEPGRARQTVALPKTLDAIMATAERAMLDTEPGKAIAVLEAAVREHEADQTLWLALARARTRLPDGAASAYEAYATALLLGESTTEAEFEAGTAASRAGLNEQAIEHYRNAESQEPNEPRYPLYAAQVLLRQGRSDEARAALYRATRLDEHLAIAWGTLGELALRENRPGVALQYVEKARAQEPEVTAWRVIEARSHNRQGNPAQSLAVLEGINEAEKLSLPVLRLYGESAAFLGRPQDAAARFAQAVRARPNDGDLAIETSQWFERAGDIPSAMRYAKHAAMLGHASAGALIERLEQK